VTSTDPTKVIWWLVSRASGVVALGLITLTVVIGLTMATKILRRPGAGRTLMRLHEHAALVAYGAIAVHGLALLGDTWLHPGLRQLVVPFALGYRPVFTGLGIIGGYLAALLGLSFYVRRRIGAKRWRKLHRATVVVWVLAAIHTLGAGSDAGTLWLRVIVLAPLVPLAYLLVLRLLPARRTERAPQPTRRPLRTARGGRSDDPAGWAATSST